MTNNNDARRRLTDGRQEDQRAGGSTTMLPQPTVIAHCRAERTRCSTGHIWVLIVDHCPLCGHQHTHGGGNQLRPSYGHRAAHCAAGRLGGYWLEPTE